MDGVSERHCPTCGEQNLGSARFCSRCGTRLSGICEVCGAELPFEARFCPRCGTAVGRASAGAGEERKLVTVLFSDVQGSTGLGERLDPERLKEVMATYFDAMQAEIEAEGGTVEKFIGDAVMAVFGVPIAHEDDPVRALRAAERMLASLERLNVDLQREYGLTLAMRIGVNTGEVLATPSPAPGRGMVAGDPVNVAARLEQMARAGHTLVGPRTARAVDARVVLRDLGSQQVRGKEEPVRVFELVDAGTSDAAGRMPASRTRGPHAPLVGRERELALLQTLFDRVREERRAHLVTIYGEAGVGKSRLVEEFEARAAVHSQGLVAARGRCLPYGEGVTYWPLAQILKAQTGVLDDDPPTLALTKFSEALGKLVVPSDADADRLRAIVGALAFTLGIEDPAGPLPEPDPHRIRTEAQEAWRTFFSALASSGPLVAVIDDIHWADAALLDLLEFLADRTTGPVLFVCPSRQELRERRPTWGGGRYNASSVLLEPLSGSESETLLGHLLEGADVSPHLQQQILQRAGGNPFFLEEIVRQLVDERRVLAAGALGPMGAEEDVEIPETIQGVLAARMDLLEAGDKRILQQSAVVGTTFWSGAVQRLLDGQDPEAVGEALDRLEERGLIVSGVGSTIGGERELSFRHGLTRDVAYQSLPRRERAAAHAAVGVWIEELAGERQREFADLLSSHYLEAYEGFADDPHRTEAETEELRGKAFGSTLLASEVARRKAVLDSAQAYAERALALAANDVERSMALEAAGLAYFHDAQGDRAWNSLTEAIDLRVLPGSSGGADARAVARLCAAALEIATRFRGPMRQRVPLEQLEPYLRIGLEHAGEGDNEERARLLIAQAFWPRAASAVSRVDERLYADARRVGEEGFDMAQRLGKRRLASAALDAVCSSFHLQGMYGPMEEPLRRRLQLAASIEDPVELGDIYGTAAWWAVNSGRYREARELADRGLIATESGSPLYALYCVDFRAVASFRLGEWEDFLTDLAKAHQLLGDRRDTPPGFASVHVALAAFLNEVQGNRQEAERNLRIIEWLEQVERSLDTAWTLWRSRLLARRRRFAEARDLLMRPAIADQGEGREEVREAWCELVREAGWWDRAPAIAADARAYGAWAGVKSLAAYADRLDGLAALAAGDGARAADLLTTAADGFERLEAAWEVAVTRFHLARALEATGRPKDARTNLAAVLPTLERLRSRRELEMAAASLERLG